MVVALICGGGNGAHVCAGIAASQPGVEARVLTLFADEAERWTKAMACNDFVVTVNSKGKAPTELKAKPTVVSKKAADVMSGVDIIVLMVPAFAHTGYLEELKPLMKPGMVLVGCPGQAGFEFAVRGILGDLARHVSLLSFESLPWACRMLEFGKKSEVLATKGSLTGALQLGDPAPAVDPTAMLQQVLGEAPKLITKGHLLGITLMGTNGYLHPSIMFGFWSHWDGKPLEQSPLFYNGVDRFSAGVLSSVSDEVVAIAKAVMQQRPQVDLNNVTHIVDWYRRCYANDITDPTDLYSCIQTNNAYNGLTHPCEQTSNGRFVPNYRYRYLTEDIPFGLVVMRGIATLAGVATPSMDKVITWAQGCLGKEYLVGDQLTGKDIPATRCPQAYNLPCLDTILGLA
uniref:Strombine dehydrogenase n=1 Tax=Arenicola marina TaxID=6344 RepID=B7FBJ2_AREMA|nr:strombine dehydrogenase [Arenicola marina]